MVKAAWTKRDTTSAEFRDAEKERENLMASREKPTRNPPISCGRFSGPYTPKSEYRTRPLRRPRRSAYRAGPPIAEVYYHTTIAASGAVAAARSARSGAYNGRRRMTCPISPREVVEPDRDAVTHKARDYAGTDRATFSANWSIACRLTDRNTFKRSTPRGGWHVSGNGNRTLQDLRTSRAVDFRNGEGAGWQRSDSSIQRYLHLKKPPL